MSDAISSKCPNCAWALKVAARLGLPSAQRLILIAIAERVDRYDCEWRGAMSDLVHDTGYSPRAIRYSLNPPKPKDGEDAKPSRLTEVLEVRHEGNATIYKLKRSTFDPDTAADPLPPRTRKTRSANIAASGDGTGLQNMPNDPAKYANGPAYFATLYIESPKSPLQSPVPTTAEPLERAREAAHAAPDVAAAPVASSSKRKRKPPAEKSGTRIADDWRLSTKGRDAAYKHMPSWTDEDIDDQAAGFFAYYQANASKNAWAKDWEAKWVTWLLHAKERQRSGSPRYQNAHDRRAKQWDDIQEAIVETRRRAQASDRARAEDVEIPAWR